MTPVDVIAAGAISALGEGQAAYAVGEAGQFPHSVVTADAELAAAGLRRPFAARVAQLSFPAGLDRAAALLVQSARGLSQQLDTVYPSWRKRRVGLVIGTSGGGMPSQLRAFETVERGEHLEPALARAATYFGPLAALQAELGVPLCFRSQVLAACASSTVAIGLACRRLELGQADLVIAGGYDALSVFITAGFEALGATTATRSAPFRQERDGMALGEGSALLALALPGHGIECVRGRVLGFGASSDAVHSTAPDRTGSGLARAARAALDDAGVTSVDLVSAHATATPFNDAAEARAMELALGDGVKDAVVHPFKAVIGHTLGAAGALESLAALDALERGVLPAAVGEGELEPLFHARLLSTNEVGRPRRCLKLSAAFGGANAALVLGARDEPGARPVARATPRVLAFGEPRTGLDVDAVLPRTRLERIRLARLDPVSALAVAAVASVLEQLDAPLPERTGVVVGTAAATLGINDAFDARRRSRGARSVEPRRFPGTSPNLAPGACSIAFGLHGPCFSVGFGPAAGTEALLAAWDLVALGDADGMLVVGVDDAAPIVREIWSAAGWRLPEPGAAALLLAGGPDGGPTREQLARAHAAAEESDGRVADAEPGWPSLLRAARLLGGAGS